MNVQSAIGRRPRRRCGFTLIELVAVMAMLSILMAMTGVVIQFVLRSDQTVAQQAVLEMTLLKLSQQFRDDVHAAVDVTPSDDNAEAPETLELPSPTAVANRVRYRVDGESLIRELISGDQSLTREAFRLPNCQIRFHREPTDEERAKAGDRPKFLVISLDRASLAITPQQPRDLKKRQLTVQAELGRDQRWLSQLLSAPPRKATSTDQDQPADAAKVIREIQP